MLSQLEINPSVIVSEGFNRSVPLPTINLDSISVIVLISLSLQSLYSHLTKQPMQSVWQTPRQRSRMPFMNLGGEEEEEMRVISTILAERRVSISLTVITKVDKLASLSWGLTRDYSPKFLYSLRVPEPDLSEPVTYQLGGIELPPPPRGDVPGNVLPDALPVAEWVWGEKVLMIRRWEDKKCQNIISRWFTFLQISLLWVRLHSTATALQDLIWLSLS